MGDRTIRYTYTLVNRLKKSFGSELDMTLTEFELRQEMARNVKANLELEKFKDLGVTFKFIFKDKKGVTVFDVEVLPFEYGGQFVIPSSI